METCPAVFIAYANDYLERRQYLVGLRKELDGIGKALKPLSSNKLIQLVERRDLTADGLFETFRDFEYKGRIAAFHFCGHADASSLLLQDRETVSHRAPAEGLFSFIGRQSSLHLVFLNGCYTASHARTLVRNRVPVVIGTGDAVDDRVAARFAIQFYDGLAMGETVEEAYLNAVNYIQTSASEDSLQYRKFHFPESAEIQEDFPFKIYYRDQEALRWRLREHPDPVGELRDIRVNGVQLDIVYEDITELPSDAMVNSCNEQMLMRGGVAAAILHKAGEGILAELKANYRAPLKLGEVAVSSGGQSGARYIYHACMVDFHQLIASASREELANAVKACLTYAEQHRVQHIAFPALGTGVARIRFRNAGDTMVEAIQAFLAKPSDIEKITIALYARSGILQTQLEEFLRAARRRLRDKP
ncbi:MAG: macro domain-containing protein [Lewinellaceae bacterium]|nr:macro domain-containing protein [Lewinellaceae bacterium]